MMSKAKRFIDIGANLTDLMYAGLYNGSKKHESDLNFVLKRAWDAGLQKIVITGGNFEESAKALDIARNDERLYITVGCHPTRCTEFEENAEGPDDYLNKLRTVIKNSTNKVVAIGECGLDYDRIKFCPKDVQKKYFEAQLKLGVEFDLPLFLHCRNAASDLFDILSKYDNLRGVVHSFDGTMNEAGKFLGLGFHIGLNGCSLKTKENLETVAGLPVNRILLETDCPWCEIRPSHAGFQYVSHENRVVSSVKKEKWKENYMVKSRNEPNNIRQVFDVVVAARKEEDVNAFCEQIYENTMTLFFNRN